MSLLSKDFRTNYLSSLGIVSTPGQQHSLQSLLEEEAINLRSLREATSKVDVPPSLRPTLWLTLLGVSPPFRSAWEYVRLQQQSEYAELQRAQQFLRDPVALKRPNPLLAAFSMALHIDALCQVSRVPPVRLADLSLLSRVFSRVLPEEHAAFYCFSSFLKLTAPAPIADRIERMGTLLPRACRDVDDLIRMHDIDLNIVTPWFRTHFTICFSSLGLERILDVVISQIAEFDFEILLALSLLHFCRKHLLQQRETQKIVRLIQVMKVDMRQLGVIISKALEFRSLLMEV